MKNISTYYNLLDFYYQIDPNPIKNIIIKQLLEDFFNLYGFYKYN